jgi:sulfofructose kinase
VATVTCVGISVWDLVFRVHRFPVIPGKYRAHERREVGGGVAANAAVAVAALGGDASLVSRLGDDATGDRIVEDLAAHGVGTTGVRRVVGRESPLSAVFVDASGERWIVNHASGDLFDSGEVPTGSEFDDADVVLADMRWPDAAVSAFAAARRRGVPAVLDCDHDPTGRPEVLAGATHAVFSLPTLASFVRVDDPAGALEAATEFTDGMPVATAGDRGVYWWDDGACHHLPAVEVAVVDTLGAGDVFHGAFALALAESRTVEAALRWASAAAALKCTRFGGRAGIPTRAEVEQLLEERV